MTYWLKLSIWIAVLPLGIAVTLGLGIWLGQDWLLSTPVVVLSSLTVQGLVGMLLFGKQGRQFW